MCFCFVILFTYLCFYEVKTNFGFSWCSSIYEQVNRRPVEGLEEAKVTVSHSSHSVRFIFQERHNLFLNTILLLRSVLFSLMY